MKKVAVLAVAVMLALASVTLAAEITGSAKIDTVGKYLWRGFNLYDGIAVQPELKVDLNNFELIFWGSYDAMVEDEYKWEESDVWVTFEDSLPFAEFILLDAGFVSYMYHYQGQDGKFSVEVYGGLTLDTLLKPSVTFYYDTMLGNGGYLELGAEHSVDLGPVSAEGSLTVGYNFSQYQDNFDGFSPSFTALLLKLGLTYDIGGSGVVIKPSLIAQLALDSQYASAVTWGVAINYDFDIKGGEIEPETKQE